MFTFLHAADIHLDSPLVGLETYQMRLYRNFGAQLGKRSRT